MNRIHANIESARKCCGFTNRISKHAWIGFVVITRLTFNNIMFMLHFGECCKILKISPMTTMNQQVAFHHHPPLPPTLLRSPNRLWTPVGDTQGTASSHYDNLGLLGIWKQDQLNHGLQGCTTGLFVPIFC